MRTRAALAALVLLGLAACAVPPEQSRAVPVRAALWKDPLSLSLIGNPDTNAEFVARLVTDSLVTLDARLRIVPQLATSWEPGEGGRTLTFHLRDGVRWHDGRPFTADDVVFTWQKVMEPDTQAKSFAADLETVQSVEALDARTVRVRYHAPDPSALLAWRVPLVPRHAAGSEPDLLRSAFAEHPVGCGPFRFVAWDHGQEIRLEAFPGYWGGPPRIPGITFAILSDDRTAWEALMAGQLHLLSMTPELARQAVRDPRARGFQRRSYSPLRVTGIWWNTRSPSAPFLADPRVRRAFSLALDRQGFIEGVVGPEVGLAAATVWHPGLPYADPTIRPLPRDPGTSGALLDEAGWKDTDGDGVRERRGKPLAFTLLSVTSSQAITERTAEWVQQELASVGARVQIKRMEFTACQERRKSGDFEATVHNVTFDPSPNLSVLLSADPEIGRMNYGRFSDPDTERLLAVVRTSPDAETRRQASAQIQHRLQEMEPITALYHARALLMLPPSLHGVETSGVGIFNFAPGPRAWYWDDGASP
jgi:peptide/nickel transport system substrate-binding protein